MRLTLNFRSELTGVSTWIVEQFDSLIAQIKGSWNIEHNEDGHHTDITATTITTTGNVAIGGGLDVTGNITGDGDIILSGTGTSTISGVRIGYVGNPAWADTVAGPGLNFNNLWTIAFTEGGSDDRFSFADHTTGYTPFMVRRYAGSYYAQPGYTSRGMGMVASLGNPNDSFGTGYWDAVYAYQHFRKDFASAQGEWTTYTPVWTNLTVGNGTVSARYTQIGKTVHWTVFVTFGSTTTVAGSIVLTTPVNNTFVTGIQRIANVEFYDASVPRHYEGKVFAASATQAVMYDVTVDPHSIVNAATPFVWATGDQIYISGSYEIA